MGAGEIIAQIKKHNNFLVTSHVNLEGDALGCELAFCHLIKLLGKNAVIVNEDTVPYNYGFLPGVSLVQKYKESLRKQIEFDCLVVLDCSDLKRTGEVYKLNTQDKPVINIDHHISNVSFGSFNWVDAESSSCSEMIYQLYRLTKTSLDRESALTLYVGILTDTGCFRYSNTTALTHKIAGELLKYNIDVPLVDRSVYGNLPFGDMRFVAGILNQMRRSADGKIIWFEVKADILKRHKATQLDLTDWLLNFARAIKGVQTAVLFKENLGVKNEVRVNFRSEGKIDVNKIARFFGGGGHKTASGATISGSLNRSVRQVLGKIREEIKML